MVEDLDMDVTMKILPIVREKDGLAMSSRNVHLKKSERADATVLYKSLNLARKSIDSGERDAKKTIKEMREMISKTSSAKIEYVSIVDTASLKDVTTLKGEVLVALAVFVGKTRLIDNAIVDLDNADKNLSQSTAFIRTTGSRRTDNAKAVESGTENNAANTKK